MRTPIVLGSIIISFLIGVRLPAQVEPAGSLYLGVVHHTQLAQTIELVQGRYYSRAENAMDLKGIRAQYTRSISPKIRVGMQGNIFWTRQRIRAEFTDAMTQQFSSVIGPYTNNWPFLTFAERLTSQFSFTGDHALLRTNRSTIRLGVNAGIIAKNNTITGTELFLRLRQEDPLIYSRAGADHGGSISAMIGGSVSYEFILSPKNRLYLSLDNMTTFRPYHYHSLLISTPTMDHEVERARPLVTLGASAGFIFSMESRKKRSDNLYQTKPKEPAKEKLEPLPVAPRRKSDVIRPKFYLGVSLIHHQQLPQRVYLIENSLSSTIGLRFTGLNCYYGRHVGQRQRLGINAALLGTQHHTTFFPGYTYGAIHSARSSYSWNLKDVSLIEAVTGRMLLAWDFHVGHGRNSVWFGAQAGVISRANTFISSALAVEQYEPFTQYTAITAFGNRIYPVAGPRAVYERNIFYSGRLAIGLESMISLVRFHSHTLTFTTDNYHHVGSITRVLSTLGVTAGYTYTGRSPHAKRTRFDW